MQREGEKCENCKYFILNKSLCIKRREKRVTPDVWCEGFEYKTQFITVDISRVEDDERFKSSYPASTNSDVIVTTSACGTASVLGVDIQQSSQERFLDEVEKIKKGEVKKGLEIMGQLNLGIIKIQIKKSWEY